MNKNKKTRFEDRNRDWDDEEEFRPRQPKQNKHRKKRFEHALRTKNIDDLLNLEDDLE